MNVYMKFLGLAAALSVAAFAGVDTYAKCRCDRGGGKGWRKQARQERRAARRGQCDADYQYDGGGQYDYDGGGQSGPVDYSDPYSPRVDRLGVNPPAAQRAGSDAPGTAVASAVTQYEQRIVTQWELQQQCGRRGCYQTWVPVQRVVSVPVQRVATPTEQPGRQSQDRPTQDRPTAGGVLSGPPTAETGDSAAPPIEVQRPATPPAEPVEPATSDARVEKTGDQAASTPQSPEAPAQETATIETPTPTALVDGSNGGGVVSQEEGERLERDRPETLPTVAELLNEIVSPQANTAGAASTVAADNTPSAPATPKVTPKTTTRTMPSPEPPRLAGSHDTSDAPALSP